jgi:hypothetical protein
VELRHNSFGSAGSALLARVQLMAAHAYARWTGAITVFVGAVAAIYYTFKGSDCIQRQYDDAYITFRYAHNLATGKGLVFNVGDATDSASSFLYTIILAFADVAGFHDLPRVAAATGVASAGVIAAVLYLAVLERTRRPLLALTLAMVVALHGLVSGWAVSGMETIFYSALVIASLYRLFILKRYGWVEAALVLAVLLTRFEGVLLAAAWAIVGAIGFFRGDRATRVRLFQYLAFVGGGFGAFLAFKFAFYGTVIPHAFALKTITTLYAPNGRAVWDVWHTDALALLGLCFAGLLTLPYSARSFGLAFYVLASVISLVRGPFADYARYSVHMLPVAALLASVPLSRLSHRYWPVVLALLAWSGYDSHRSLMGRRAAIVEGAGHEKCRTEVGQFLERTLPAGTLVLSSDIGVIAYAAPSIKFVDTVGLTSKDVLQARIDGDNVDKVLFSARPIYIADTCEGKCRAPDEFSAYNWLTRESYWRTPLPRQEYTSHLVNGKLLYRCESPDGLLFGASKFELVDPGQPHAAR